jgi:hypothetical protein
MSDWIAVQPRIIGTVEKYDTCYDWDGETFPHRMAAIDHGLNTFGSDDFNVGELRDGKLVWWGWMDQRGNNSHALLEDLAAVSAALGFDVALVAEPTDLALGRCQAMLQCHRETGHQGGHEPDPGPRVAELEATQRRVLGVLATRRRGVNSQLDLLIEEVCDALALDPGGHEAREENTDERR